MPKWVVMKTLIVYGNQMLLINNKMLQFEVYPNNINSDNCSSNNHINLKVLHFYNCIKNIALN